MIQGGAEKSLFFLGRYVSTCVETENMLTHEALHAIERARITFDCSVGPSAS